MNWPPKPAVEEEHEALAKEHLASEIRATIIAFHDPPFRGAVDQYPIILDANMDAKLCDEHTPEIIDKDNGEWRFILLPKAETFPQSQPESELLREEFIEHPTAARYDAGAQTSTRHEGRNPPIERRRSRTDLPSLQTKLNPETMQTASDVKRSDSVRHGRTPSTDVLLSPDIVPSRGSRSHFDPPSLPSSRHNSSGSSVHSASGRHRSASNPRPTTPIHDKKLSISSDTYRETLPRSQVISEESGSRHSDRHHLDADHGRSYRRSSNQSNKSPRSSSSEGSDSERRRRKGHRRQTSTTPRPDDDRGHYFSTSPRSPRPQFEPRSSNRYSSPLPSPKVSPSQIPLSDRTSDVRENRRPSPRPLSPTPPYPETPRSSSQSLGLPPGVPHRGRSPSHSRRQSPTNGHSAGNTSSTVPIPIPMPTKIDIQSPGESHHSPTIPDWDDRRGNPLPPSSPKPYWQPPPFEPPETSSAHLERPLGSYRRYSQDVKEGNVAPLPPCPRSSPVRGYIDWLTLPKTPSFNICPSCYESIIEPTEFRTHFVPAPVRSPNDEIVCDFGSQPWFRIAWLLVRKEHKRDLGLLRGIAEITETAPPCLGKHEAVRKWYSIIDPKTGNLIRGFNVCYSCVRCIETLLKPLRGIFVRADLTAPSGMPRICDMRFDSKRFIHYFDALEVMTEKSLKYEDEPDTRDFAELVKHSSSIPECMKDQPLHSGRWHVITQLPEFTVCPECFDEVVLPGLAKRKAIPTMFNKSLQQIPLASCQLYSQRMRAIFDKAVNNDDYKFLATKARDRSEMELDLKSEMAGLKREGKASGKRMMELEAEWARWE